MTVRITIRDVPAHVRDELAARAARQGKSMQEYLRSALERLTAKPPIDAWFDGVRRRKQAAKSRVSARDILRSRHAGRR